MKNLLSKLIARTRIRGFVMPLTLVICLIILTISAGISIILAKELYFSRLSRLSQVAYYAADDGMMCATMIDDKYIDPDTGLGIFPYGSSPTEQQVLDKVNLLREANGLTNDITLNSIKCGTSAIFTNAITGYTVSSFSRIDSQGNTDTGRASTFSMTMDLGDGTTRCATVTINKTPNYRQIISRGFASCSTTSLYRIERAIVSTTQSDTAVAGGGGGSGTSSVQMVFTSGTSWTVPAGVTSLKVWAIGGGGGGAGSPVNDSRAGGGGGSGGVAVKTYSVSPGDVVSFSLGTGGTGSTGSSNGNNGGDTTVTIKGVSIAGRGGSGGRFDSTSSASGGSTTGTTDVSSTGGTGAGAKGDVGGGGGGGIGGASGSSSSGGTGGSGGQAADVSGLFSVLTSLGYATTAPGSGADNGSTPVDTKNGGSATGFGSGGGGAGWYGGNGGNGLYGGGGGGASGYVNVQHTGGSGGQGVVVVASQ